MIPQCTLSGSQFFRMTTGIDSGPDALDESRFIMTFLTILGVTEILCSFRLVLEGKTGNEIPESSRLEFLEVFSNISRPLNRGGISDLSFLGILLAICQKSWRAKFLGSDRLFCFISI